MRALELAKTFLAPTEVLNSLWPCQSTFSLGLGCRLFLTVTYSYIVLRARAHSIPPARQGATHKAFSGLRKRWNTASITPFNTGLRCHAAPPPSSIGHLRNGDFFTVNNDRRHRFFFQPRHCVLVASLYLSGPPGTLCFLFLMSSYYVCCGLCFLYH